MPRFTRISPLVAALFVPFAVGCSDPVSQAATPPNTTTVTVAAPAPDGKEEAKRVPAPGAPQAGGGKWVTLKGQVLMPEAAVQAMGEKKPINAAAEPMCLANGPLFPEDTIVNPKTRGIQNVVVWLRPANKERDPKLPAEAIHPDLAKGKVKPAAHVVDQPCCQFVPRITLAREGDSLEFKNSAPKINHNTKWSSNENGEFNVNIAPGQSYKLPNPLKYERTQIPFECNSHPWMKGQVRVFDHPYFALTDADGKFEIKNAPVGTFHIVYAHENGFHKGAEGRFGWPVEIKDDGKGTMELKPLEYEFPKN
jgi:hypothetical protein